MIITPKHPKKDPILDFKLTQENQSNATLNLDLSASDSAYAIQPDLEYAIELYKDGVLLDTFDSSIESINLVDFGAYEIRTKVTNYFGAFIETSHAYPFHCSLSLTPLKEGFLN